MHNQEKQEIFFRPAIRLPYKSSLSLTGQRLATKLAEAETTSLGESSGSLITEIETGRGVAIASPILRHASGKRLLYRPLTGMTEVLSVGIARATKGDVTPAGEKFCEILRMTSDGATLAKTNVTRSF